MRFNAIPSDGNEETKASAVPFESGFSMSGEWCIMGLVREREAVMNQRDGVLKHVCYRAAPCSSSRREST